MDGGVSAKTGGKVLAIPHNGNLSNGRMFEEKTFTGGPMTKDYAQERQRWEPLMELTQIKGQSESHPSLSPADEFASWDLWDRGNLNGVPKKPGMIRTEYCREALKNGLKLEASWAPIRSNMVPMAHRHAHRPRHRRRRQFLGQVQECRTAPRPLAT